jgi:hypothetical protein
VSAYFSYSIYGCFCVRTIGLLIDKASPMADLLHDGEQEARFSMHFTSCGELVGDTYAPADETSDLIDTSLHN